MFNIAGGIPAFVSRLSHTEHNGIGKVESLAHANIIF
jgi:hypothetical protein